MARFKEKVTTALVVSLSHKPPLGAAGNGQKPAIKPHELNISFCISPGHVAVVHHRQKCSSLYQLVCRRDVCGRLPHWGLCGTAWYNFRVQRSVTAIIPHHPGGYVQQFGWGLLRKCGVWAETAVWMFVSIWGWWHSDKAAPKEKSRTVLLPLQIWKDSDVQESSAQNIKSTAQDQTKDLSSTWSYLPTKGIFKKVTKNRMGIWWSLWYIASSNQSWEISWNGEHIWLVITAGLHWINISPSGFHDTVALGSRSGSV